MNIWSLGEVHILQTINCAWKITSLRASETPADRWAFQVALRRDAFTVQVWHKMIQGPAWLISEDKLD